MNQLGDVCFNKLSKRQRLTKSLLFGSENSISTKSALKGGSCGTAPLSKPYMLCSAADAASAAIDYLKGNIEDRIVDSPPSRGPVKTPICSPSPLKRASLSWGCSFLSPHRTEAATSRRLDLPELEVGNYPLGEDKVPSSKPLDTKDVTMRKSTSLHSHDVRNALLEPEGASALARIEGKQNPSSKSRGGRRTLFADTLFRQQILREHQRSLVSKHARTGLPYIDNVNASLPRPPPLGSRSLSAFEVPQSTRKSKCKDSGLKSLSIHIEVDGGSRRHCHSRRKDILRGVAKLKAIEAAHSDCTANREL